MWGKSIESSCVIYRSGFCCGTFWGVVKAIIHFMGRCYGTELVFYPTNTLALLEDFYNSDRIVGGEEAVLGQFLFQVEYIYFNYKNTNKIKVR